MNNTHIPEKMDWGNTPDTKKCEWIYKHVLKQEQGSENTISLKLAQEVVQSIHGQLFSHRLFFKQFVYDLVTEQYWGGDTNIAYEEVLFYLTPDIICHAAFLVTIGSIPPRYQNTK